MHDDQHIARLFLLAKGISEGQLYPRWVDMLGFGFGYPLFNFYPPLIYYVSLVFHFFGFSYIWSVKLMIITGFVLAALGMFYLVKEASGKASAYLGAAAYTYFLYHSVTVYIRGALAEFFTLAILPFVFLGLIKLAKKVNLNSSLFFGVSLALLVLSHPLIAFPSLIFIGILFILLFLANNQKTKFILLTMFSGLLSLGLSAFFWLPSMVERKYTLVDQILTKELASYKDHFIYLQQLWYSPWGYGGSTPGTGDGLTFQLGKIPIFLLVVSIFLAFAYFIQKKEFDKYIKMYAASIFLLFVSLFMTTSYSSFIWDNIKYLWYMQFPWRFLTFTNIFISTSIAFSAFFVKELINRTSDQYKKYRQTLINLLVLLAIVVIGFKYYQYFKPQKLINTSDQKRTNFQEIAWRISSTSYEFVPNKVATKKTSLGTTTLAINEVDLPISPFKIISGQATTSIQKNLFADKEFNISAGSLTIFQLNTYNFPGWQASIDGHKVTINSNNKLDLITISVPKGKHRLKFEFTDTLIRKIADYTSLISLILLLVIFSYSIQKSLIRINKINR